MRVDAGTCIVGAGLSGRWHADAVARLGGHVAAIVDLDSNAAQRLATLHAGAVSTESLASARTQAEFGIVHICTPLPTHVALAEEALRLKSHVVLEKPAAPTLDATERLLEHADQQGVMLTVMHQFLFQRGTRTAIHRVAVEELRHLAITIISAGGEGHPERLDEIAADILPHPISVALAFGAGPQGETLRVLAPKSGEMLATWSSASGALVTVRISMSGRPPRAEAMVVTDRETLWLDFFHGFSTAEPGAVSRGRKIAAPFDQSARRTGAAALNLARRVAAREPAYPGQRELIRRFYESTNKTTPPPLSREEILACAGVRDQILALAAGELVKR